MNLKYLVTQKQSLVRYFLAMMWFMRRKLATFQLLMWSAISNLHIIWTILRISKARKMLKDLRSSMPLRGIYSKDARNSPESTISVPGPRTWFQKSLLRWRTLLSSSKQKFWREQKIVCDRSLENVCRRMSSMRYSLESQENYSDRLCESVCCSRSCFVATWYFVHVPGSKWLAEISRFPTGSRCLIATYLRTQLTSISTLQGSAKTLSNSKVAKLEKTVHVVIDQGGDTTVSTSKSFWIVWPTTIIGCSSCQGVQQPDVDSNPRCWYWHVR